MSDICLAIVTRDNKFLLLKRSSTDKNNPGRWALPGGHVEDGESLTEGLLRELKEETNLDSKELFCRKIHEMPHENENKTIHIFWIMKTKGDVILQDGEHDEFVWCSADGASMYNPLKHIEKTFKSIEKQLKDI